jgi:hypothetical protein
MLEADFSSMARCGAYVVSSEIALVGVQSPDEA